MCPRINENNGKRKLLEHNAEPNSVKRRSSVLFSSSPPLFKYWKELLACLPPGRREWRNSSTSDMQRYLLGVRGQQLVKLHERSKNFNSKLTLSPFSVIQISSTACVLCQGILSSSFPCNSFFFASSDRISEKTSFIYKTTKLFSHNFLKTYHRLIPNHSIINIQLTHLKALYQQ